MRLLKHKGVSHDDLHRPQQQQRGERVQRTEAARWGRGGERFLPHIKVFTWLCMCSLGEKGNRGRRGHITLGWQLK